MGILDTVTKAVGSVAGAVGDALAGSSDGEAKDNQATVGANSKVRIQYYRSAIGSPKTHKQIVRSLGITKLNQVVERPDNPSTRGTVNKLPHLLRVVE